MTAKVDTSTSPLTNSVDMGALPLSVDMYACGVDTSRMAVRVERGPMSLGAVPLIVSTIKLAVEIHCCATNVLYPVGEGGTCE